MYDFGSRCIQMLACEYNLRYDDLRLAYYDAQKKGISSLMLMPNHLPVLSAEKETSSDPLHLIAVSAYPAGCQPLSSKITEIQEAISMGADEIFLVPMNGLILDNQWEKVEAELRGCKEAAGQIPITLIMELQVFDAEHAKNYVLSQYRAVTTGLQLLQDLLIIAFFLSQIHLPWLLWFAQLNQNRFAMYATGLVTPSILLLLTQP